MHSKAQGFLVQFIQEEIEAHQSAAGKTPVTDDRIAHKTAAYLLRSFLNINTKMNEAENREREKEEAQRADYAWDEALKEDKERANGAARL